ncbi:MAG TPA: NUDIX hydrolase [Solirubrobacterales bacterium]|nr:NUDIX hydrolase [Solirubrobacterales bacterium]
MEAAPATPRPAATVILLRRGGRHRQRRVEVLLVRRAEGASFMPGVWVFPGGAIEPDEDPAACAARELAEEAGIELPDPGDLVLFSRWITPEVVPVRFDTHFLVGLAPPHSPPRPDGTEVSEAAWFEPRAAIDAQQAGEIELVFPTVKTLESLLAFASADEVIAAARERTVEPILPRVVGTRERHRILLPGDPGYE